MTVEVGAAPAPGVPSRGRRAVPDSAWGLLLAIAVALVYHPVLLRCFGMVDDYVFLSFVTFGEQHYLRFLTAVGRPLQDVLLSSALTVIRTSCDLVWLRAAAVLAIGLFALLVQRDCRANGWSPAGAFSVALTLSALPAFGVYASWAIAFPIPLALVLGYLGSALWLSGMARQGWRTGLRMLGAAAAWTAALTLYQPAAFAMLLPLAIATSGPSAARGALVPQGISAVATFGVLAFGTLLLAHELAAPLIASEPLFATLAERGRPVQDIAAKLGWFVTYPLPLAANPWGLSVNLPTAGIIAAFALTGMGIQWRRAGHPGLALASLGLIGIGFVPLLAIAENPESLRILGVPGAVLAFFFLLGIRATCEAIGLAGLARTALPVIALLTALSTHQLVSSQIVDLHAEERTRTLDRLAGLGTVAPTDLVVLPPAFSNPIPGASPFVEYGMTSAAVPYSVKYLVQQLLWEAFGVQTPPQIHVCADPAASNPCGLAGGEDLAVLDLRVPRP